MQLLYELSELMQKKHLRLLVSREQKITIIVGRLLLLLLSLVLFYYSRPTDKLGLQWKDVSEPFYMNPPIFVGSAWRPFPRLPGCWVRQTTGTFQYRQ